MEVWSRPEQDSIICSYVQCRSIKSITSANVGGVWFFQCLVIVGLAARSVCVMACCRFEGYSSISKDRIASAGFGMVLSWVMSEMMLKTSVQYDRCLSQLHRTCRRSLLRLHSLQHLSVMLGLNLNILAGVKCHLKVILTIVLFFTMLFF